MGSSRIQGDTGQTTPSHLLPQWKADHSGPYALTLRESLHTRYRLAHAQTAASHRRLSSRQSTHTTSCTVRHLHAGALHCTRTTRTAREKCRARDIKDTNDTPHKRSRDSAYGSRTPQSQQRQTQHRIEIIPPRPPTNLPHQSHTKQIAYKTRETQKMRHPRRWHTRRSHMPKLRTPYRRPPTCHCRLPSPPAPRSTISLRHQQHNTHNLVNTLQKGNERRRMATKTTPKHA